MPLCLLGFRDDLVRFWAAAVIVTSSFVAVAARSDAQDAEKPARIPAWPCRLIAQPTVNRMIEKGWNRSETIRRQCDELAAARAVVALEWGAMDSQSHAKTGMATRGGVVVARVKLPPIGDTIVLMAHELQHVLEQTRGLDLETEAKLPGSGVWRAFGGYETQAAVDVSRQVAKELRLRGVGSANTAPKHGSTSVGSVARTISIGSCPGFCKRHQNTPRGSRVLRAESDRPHGPPHMGNNGPCLQPLLRSTGPVCTIDAPAATP